MPVTRQRDQVPEAAMWRNGHFMEAGDSEGQLDTSSNTDQGVNVKNSNGHQTGMDVIGQEMETEYKCGYGSCTPKPLQRLHAAKCLLATLSLCAITQGIVVNGLIPVSITTLEKRFHFSSTQSGIFASMYDIAILLVLVPLSHFGGKGHKGRYLGWGVLIMGIGSFICALPQFTTGLYDYGQAAITDTCQTVGNASIVAEDCSSGSGQTITQLRLYFYVFLFAQLLHGIGASPLYTLGITYIDENTSQRASPVYLGIFSGFSTVGPALGFLLGGMLLRVYGDIGKVDLSSVHLSVHDPRWYGAWWIGFVMVSVLALVFSIPMLSFARELPEAKQHRLKDIDQTNRRSSTDGAFKADAFSGNLQEIWMSCVQLMKNPTFTCLMIMQVAEVFLINGFVLFMPKLVENVFSMSSSTASMITGAILVPCGFFGNIFGGYLIRRLNLLCQGVILCALIFQAGSAVFFFGLLADCPKPSFIGITHPYMEGQEFPTAELLNSCNARCKCDNYYQPVCNQFEYTNYFSACFAGCTGKFTSEDGTKSWSDCGCVRQRINLTQWNPVPSAATNQSSSPDSVRQGLCPTTCKLTALFFVLFSIEVFLTFSSAMPIQQAELRCVPFRLRTMAVGLRWIFARLLGAVPGTIGFGAAIDTTCIYWGARCGERASCVQYDSRRMTLVMMGFALVLKAIVVTSLFLAWKFYIPPPEVTKAVGQSAGAGPVRNVDHHLGHKVSPTSRASDTATKF